MTNECRPNTLPEGYALGCYQIQNMLGRGGFGITYRALDTRLKKHVAIKEFLPSDFATRTHDSEIRTLSHGHVNSFEWGLSRFLEEAQTLAKFEHPNIVSVHSAFESNGTAYMVMEYVQGNSLEELFKFKDIADEQAMVEVLEPLMDGIQTVHDRGFIHRDIKPQNILLREDGTPVLVDFGSARLTPNPTSGTSLTALVSPGYAPIEQYNGDGDGEGEDENIDHRQGPWTDIYALAATIYRGVSGRPPPDVLTRVTAIMKGGDSLTSISEAGNGHSYSPTFLEALDWALEFQPQKRPQSMAEWRPALFSVRPPRIKELRSAKPKKARPASDCDLADAVLTRQLPSSQRKEDPKQYIQAYAWFSVAANAGLPEAQQSRDRVRAHLSESELEEALSLSRKLWDKYARKH